MLKFLLFVFREGAECPVAQFSFVYTRYCALSGVSRVARGTLSASLPQGPWVPCDYLRMVAPGKSMAPSSVNQSSVWPDWESNPAYQIWWRVLQQEKTSK